MIQKSWSGNLICKADYKHGNLTYHVSIHESPQPIQWEHEDDAGGRFYVEYVEETLPSKNVVGGFKTVEDAMSWVNSQFGRLNWHYYDK